MLAVSTNTKGIMEMALLGDLKSAHTMLMFLGPVPCAGCHARKVNGWVSTRSLLVNVSGEHGMQDPGQQDGDGAERNE